MLDLTFGEQVKIILRRKGMTIKELAAVIEEKTGKKMSRQNLTQRLGRDNFQEQDMRMIAEILGCQFRLSILDDSISAEKKFKETIEKKEIEVEDVSEYERDITIGELVDIHQELDALEESAAEQVVTEEPVEEVGEETVEEPVEEAAEEEEVYEEAYEEPYEEEVYEEEAYEEPYEEEVYEEEAYEEPYEEEVYEEEAYEEPNEEVYEEEAYEEPYEEEVYEEEPASVEDILREMEELERESKGYESAKAARIEAEKKSHGWKSYLQFRRKKEQEEVKPVQVTVKEPVQEEVEEADEEMLDDTQIIYLEDDEDLGDEGLAELDEDAPVMGDVNPYTGREYESNSVRIHPKRIGYVQVYDRGEHKWTDMTEWAFLGYQERKKALLGKDYEPPIYLD